jgi:hypothetical protein
MNTEQLYLIAKTVDAYFKASGTLQGLEEVRNAANNYASNPAPEHQRALSDAYTKLESKLKSDPGLNIPYLWRSALKEMDIEGYYGQALRKKLQVAIGNNFNSASKMKSNVDDLYNDTSVTFKSLERVISAFDNLRLDAQDEKIGWVEFTVKIPKDDLNDGSLTKLGGAIEDINKNFKFLLRILDSTPEDLKFSSLSNKDPKISIQVNIDVARILWGVFAFAYLLLGETPSLESAIKTMDKFGIDDIKSIIEEKLQERANQKIEEYVDNTIASQMEGRPAADVNEVKAGAKVAIKWMIKKIQDGYVFDHRILDNKETELTENELLTINHTKEVLSQTISFQVIEYSKDNLKLIGVDDEVAI